MSRYKIILKSGKELEVNASHIDFPGADKDGLLKIWAREDIRETEVQVVESEVAAIQPIRD